MIEILVQIISDLTSFTYINAIELVISVITVVILALTLFFVIKYTKAAEMQTDELILQRKAAESQTDEIIMQRKAAENQTAELILQRLAAERQTEELIRQRRLSNLPSLSMDVDFGLIKYEGPQKKDPNVKALKHWDGQKKELWIKFIGRIANFGNGIALNVSTVITCNYFKPGMYFEVDPIDLVKRTVDENIDPYEVMVKFVCEGVFNLPHDLDHFIDSIADKQGLKFTITFNFQDIEGAEYQQKVFANFDIFKQGVVVPL